MTLTQRAVAYAKAFPKYPSSHLRVVYERGGQCLYGTWCLGNDYRNKTRYYGAYPPSYLERVSALFPDLEPFNSARCALRILHAFSGSLPKGPYVRCDMAQDAEIKRSVYDLDPTAHGSYELIYADPPYSVADAEKYETVMVDRRRAIAALARVARAGAFLVWLDTCWPMHRKTEWRTVGRITLIRSTNHRVRLISIFERQAA